jgi:hypothetical protein
MKRAIRLFGLLYGCIGAICAFVWYIAASLGRATIPDNVWMVEAVFILHAVAMLITFQPAARHPWQPVFTTSRTRIRFAKVLLGLSAANFLFCFGLMIFARGFHYNALFDHTPGLVLTSFLLLNTIYIATHWAFRPENLFSESFIKFISNPIGYFL